MILPRLQTIRSLKCSDLDHYKRNNSSPYVRTPYEMMHLARDSPGLIMAGNTGYRPFNAFFDLR